MVDGIWKFLFFLPQKRLFCCSCVANAVEVEFPGDLPVLESGNNISPILYLPASYVFFLNGVRIDENWEKIELFKIWFAVETICRGVDNLSYLGCGFWFIPYASLSFPWNKTDSWGDQWSNVGVVLSHDAGSLVNISWHGVCCKFPDSISILS